MKVARRQIMKLYLKIAAIIVFVLTLCISAGMIFLPTGEKAYAETISNEEYDVVFLQNITELAQDTYGGNIELTATKESVFDLELNHLGFIYEFSINEQNGYAIVINTSGYFEVAEVYFDANNPYSEVVGKPIYISNMIYLYYSNGEFYNSETGAIISDVVLSALSTNACYANGNATYVSWENIYYNNKQELEHKLAYRHPGIIQISNYSNACAAVAGANLVQYWDRFKPNLIANFTPGTALGSNYIYKEPDSNTSNVIGQLYYDMETNIGGSGATIAQFKNGLSTYCQRYGYNVTYTSCLTNGNFSYASAKQYLENSIPLVLFVDPFTIAEVTTTAQGNDYIEYIICDAPHVMAGFGYREITYTLSDNTTREDKYIAVASGITNKSRGYFNINYNTIIDDAYAVNIM